MALFMLFFGSLLALQRNSSAFRRLGSSIGLVFDTALVSRAVRYISSAVMF
jgi:hypothetical protein